MSDHQPADDFAVWSPTLQFSRRDLERDPLGFRKQVAPGERAELRTDDAAVVAAAVLSLDRWACEVRLVPPSATAPPATDAVQLDIGADRATDPAPPREGGPDTRWVLQTSGTTGAPKSISHTLGSLTRTVARSAGPLTWGLVYDPNRMAGLQVLLQGLLSEGRVVAPSLVSPLPARLSTMIDRGVDALSATPSLWRQIMQVPRAAQWPLRQITLGGEIADQRLLDALAERYAGARIVHVFASTETGAAFSVTDGREGFPRSYLDEPPRGIELDVRDGILHVHSPDVSVAGPDGFASTGDIVEIVDDRVLFRGRASGVVNVGGTNVWPEVVEALLREHPDVVEAVVTPRPNPLMGNVLVAEVSLQPGTGGDDIVKRLRSWVRERAPRTHVPASIDVVDEVRVSSTGKVSR